MFATGISNDGDGVSALILSRRLSPRLAMDAPELESTEASAVQHGKRTPFGENERLHTRAPQRGRGQSMADNAKMPPRWAIRLNIFMLRLGAPIRSEEHTS